MIVGVQINLSSIALSLKTPSKNINASREHYISSLQSWQIRTVYKFIAHQLFIIYRIIVENNVGIDYLSTNISTIADNQPFSY